MYIYIYTIYIYKLLKMYNTRVYILICIYANILILWLWAKLRLRKGSNAFSTIAICQRTYIFICRYDMNHVICDACEHMHVKVCMNMCR